MLGFCGNYNKTLGCFLPVGKCSIRKFRVRKPPDVFQKWGANMLELVGTKGIDEGGEIAQESHRYPKCFAKRFLCQRMLWSKPHGKSFTPSTVLERDRVREREVGQESP